MKLNSALLVLIIKIDIMPGALACVLHWVYLTYPSVSQAIG